MAVLTSQSLGSRMNCRRHSVIAVWWRSRWDAGRGSSTDCSLPINFLLYDECNLIIMIQELWKWSLLAICIRNWHFSPYIAGLAAEKQLSWHLSSNQDGHRKAFIISSGCPISFPLPPTILSGAKTIKETKPLWGLQLEADKVFHVF